MALQEMSLPYRLTAITNAPVETWYMKCGAQIIKYLKITYKILSVSQKLQ